MKSRFFLAKVPPIAAVMSRKFFSTACKQPPILLLAEDHSRPAARIALTRALPELKQRNYNFFMREGIGCGKTLSQEIVLAKEYEKLMQLLFLSYPILEKLLNMRLQLTKAEFQNACLLIFNQKKMTEEQINALMTYDRNDHEFYQELARNSFSYKNLDENYSQIPFQSLSSRSSLDTRDDLYVHELRTAYRQGKGVVSLLGGAHLLSDGATNGTYDFYYGKRRLIGNRLDELGIPYIGLFPFDSRCVASAEICKAWQMNSPKDVLNPSEIYSLDIAQSQSAKVFLNLIDQLLIARQEVRATKIKLC